MNGRIAEPLIFVSGSEHLKQRIYPIISDRQHKQTLSGVLSNDGYPNSRELVCL